MQVKNKQSYSKYSRFLSASPQDILEREKRHFNLSLIDFWDKLFWKRDKNTCSASFNWIRTWECVELQTVLKIAPG